MADDAPRKLGADGVLHEMLRVCTDEALFAQDAHDLTPPPPFTAAAADRPTRMRDDLASGAASGGQSHAAHAFPTCIGRYSLIRPLGQGGMGVVYLGRDAASASGKSGECRESGGSGGSGGEVAIKLIRDPARLGPQAVARFEREVRLAQRLKHPGIVAIHETGRWQDQPFFVMEFMAGGDLRRLCGVPQAPSTVCGLFTPIARAVHFAHDQGVVHRDLKPSNILMTIQGEPKVADFGLARAVDPAQTITDSDLVLGTPGYMAPEQLLGNSKHADHRADIYALGVMLYELLCGRRPFGERRAVEMVQAMMRESPPPPSRFRCGIPHALDAICLRCLARDPAQRYPTAGQLAVDLQGVAQGAP